MNPGFNRCILGIKLDVQFLCFVRNDEIYKLYISLVHTKNNHWVAATATARSPTTITGCKNSADT